MCCLPSLIFFSQCRHMVSKWQRARLALQFYTDTTKSTTAARHVGAKKKSNSDDSWM